MRGHRPVVGAWDCKHLLHVSAVVNVAAAAVHANLLEGPRNAKAKTGRSKTRRPQEAFAAHLRHVGRQHPAAAHPRVVTLMDNAPWHAGEPVRAAPAANPHPELKRRPSHGPQLNPIERFRKLLRRRAARDRLFDTLADLRRSIRSSLSYYQTVRIRVKTMLGRNAKKQTLTTGT